MRTPPFPGKGQPRSCGTPDFKSQSFLEPFLDLFGGAPTPGWVYRGSEQPGGVAGVAGVAGASRAKRPPAREKPASSSLAQFDAVSETGITFMVKRLYILTMKSKKMLLHFDHEKFEEGDKSGFRVERKPRSTPSIYAHENRKCHWSGRRMVQQTRGHEDRT